MKTKTRLLSIAMVFLIGTSTLSFLTHQTNAVTSGLVGYWKFDEGSGTTAHDSSGNGNDGIIHDATWVTGKVGNALYFNGVDSWVEIPSNPTLSGLSQLSIETWTKLDSQTVDVKGIVCKLSGTAEPAPDNEYGLWLNDYSNIHFSVYNGNHVFIASGDNSIASTGTWYHVAGTWNGTHYALYVNSLLLNSGTNSPISPYSNPIELQIGRMGVYSWTYFHGTIDEVKIYNYARTAQEIMNDYNLISPTSESPSWMQWWFWTIVGLGAVAVVFASTTVYYARKPSTASKQASVTQGKPLSRTNKVCPKCGASLPMDSKFCGKCGASLE